jgi:predicted O-methyltransferase YrrM
MAAEVWNEVDRNFIGTLGLSDPALDHALRESDRAGLPAISVSAPSNPQYVEWAVRLARRGAVIVLDNVVRGGKVIFADESVQGVRRAMDIFRAGKRLAATAIQTVGTKGYDGFAVALVMEG